MTGRRRSRQGKRPLSGGAQGMHTTLATEKLGLQPFASSGPTVKLHFKPHFKSGSENEIFSSSQKNPP